VRFPAARNPLAAYFLAFLCAAGMMYYTLVLYIPKVLEVRAANGLGNGYAFADDAYPVWLTSRESLLHHREPYSPEMTREIQIGLFGRPLDAHNPLDPPPGYRAFAYPAFVDVLFWPLVYVPFPILRVILAALFPLMTAAGVLFWLKAMRFRPNPATVAILILLTLCSYQMLEALFAEQLGLVVGLALAAAMAALAAGRYMAAGTLLALTTIKPQMVILLIFCLLLWSLGQWRERRRVVQSFAATQLLLCASAFFLWPHWLTDWLAVLWDYRHYSTPALTSDLLGPQFGPMFGPALAVLLIALGVAAAWRVRGCSPASSEFWLMVSLVLAITVVSIMPGHAFYDQIVLLPGIILVMRFRRSLASSKNVIRWLLAIAAAALFWQWIAALALIAVRPLISHDRFYSVPVFALPIRLVGIFPFALLALLGVMMRHTFRGSLELNTCVESAPEPTSKRSK
jgi:hypothetical protein